jgi:hypothetical protein
MVYGSDCVLLELGVLTWSVADGCVKGCADDGDVVVLIGLDQTLDGLQVGETGNAGEGPLDRCLLDLCLQLHSSRKHTS